METNTIHSSQTSTEAVTPKELVWKHIKDPNHIITDDEFKKVMVGMELEERLRRQKN